MNDCCQTTHTHTHTHTYIYIYIYIVIATSSLKKTISTMFGCEHASGSEFQLCFYASYWTKGTWDPRLSLVHTRFSRGRLSSWDRIWPARDRQAPTHTLPIWSGLNVRNVSRMSDLCHFRSSRLRMKWSSCIAFYSHYKRVSSKSHDSSLSFSNLQNSCQEFYIYHHNHVTLSAQISLTLSRYPSLSSIASGGSSGLHPESAQSCCM